MDRTHYWELIEKAREAAESADAKSTDTASADTESTDTQAPDADAVADAFTAELAELDADSITQAWLRHRDLLNDAYSWPVWGAAYLLLGGCSDDSFDYFRSWLITQGRESFDAVIDDPDSLVDLVPEGEIDEDWFACEELESAPATAYEQVTGEQMPEHRDLPAQPDLGEEFDFDDDEVMKVRYPRLWARVNE